MRLILGGLGTMVAGLVLFEVTMQPSRADRVLLATIFGLMVAATIAAALILPRLARSIGSLRVTVAVLSLISFLIVALGLLASANRMFFSDHDLALMLVVLGVGLLAALGFAVVVSRPLTSDLRSISGVADRVAHGDFAVRTDVARADEVGALAHSVDSMASALAEAEQERERNEASRREFFAAVGHDLRTPLASLRAAVEALQDGVAADPARYLESIDRDLAAMSSLIDDLFLLARIDSGTFTLVEEPLDLTELADEAVEVLRPLAELEGIELRLEADHRVVARGGQEAVGRVLRNLLDNAIRYAPLDSEVVIRVGNGTSATVLVVDEGPGFDPEFVDHAFDRFSRDDPSRARDRGGAGLGLAIAREFVTALGGEIWAEPGPGGTVGFRLPTDDGFLRS